MVCKNLGHCFRLLAGGVLLSLASCTPQDFFYIDPATRLAAPELVSAWKSGGPLASAVVEVSADAPSEVLADLKRRSAKPHGVLLGLSLNAEQIQALQSNFPTTRFVQVQPIAGSLQGSSVATLEFPQTASWEELAHQAATEAGPQASALIIVPETTASATISALEKAWMNSTPRQRPEFILWNPRTSDSATELQKRLTAPVTDIFILGVDTDQLVLSPLPAKTRVHRDLDWVGAESSPGLVVRLDASGLSQALHGALGPGAPTVSLLPWKIVRKSADLGS